MFTDRGDVRRQVAATSLDPPPSTEFRPDTVRIERFDRLFRVSFDCPSARLPSTAAVESAKTRTATAVRGGLVVRALLIGGATALACWLLLAVPAHAQQEPSALADRVGAGAPLVALASSTSAGGLTPGPVPPAAASPAGPFLTDAVIAQAVDPPPIPNPLDILAALDPRKWAGDILDAVVTAIGRSLLEAMRELHRLGARPRWFLAELRHAHPGRGHRREHDRPQPLGLLARARQRRARGGRDVGRLQRRRQGAHPQPLPRGDGAAAARHPRGARRQPHARARAPVHRRQQRLRRRRSGRSACRATTRPASSSRGSRSSSWRSPTAWSRCCSSSRC